MQAVGRRMARRLTFVAEIVESPGSQGQVRRGVSAVRGVIGPGRLDGRGRTPRVELAAATGTQTGSAEHLLGRSLGEGTALTRPCRVAPARCGGQDVSRVGIPTDFDSPESVGNGREKKHHHDGSTPPRFYTRTSVPLPTSLIPITILRRSRNKTAGGFDSAARAASAIKRSHVSGRIAAALIHDADAASHAAEKDHEENVLEQHEPQL